MCFEIGNALAKLRFRAISVQFLDGLESSSTTDIVPLTEDLHRQAFDLYRQRLDKEWSLTDCLSFVVMRQRGLTEALTSDEHFEQMGFKALLRQRYSPGFLRGTPRPPVARPSTLDPSSLPRAIFLLSNPAIHETKG